MIKSRILGPLVGSFTIWLKLVLFLMYINSLKLICFVYCLLFPIYVDYVEAAVSCRLFFYADDSAHWSQVDRFLSLRKLLDMN